MYSLLFLIALFTNNKQVFVPLSKRSSVNKIVIILRTDLNMRKGKMAAQASHAVQEVLLDRSSDMPCLRQNNPDMWEWLNNGKYTKIVVGISSENDLHAVYQSALNTQLPASLIQDSGKTEFSGVPTYTAVAIGPSNVDRIDALTGHLKLL
jgi:PTH2 family peptidyl-tRNA hydrolase